MTVLASVDLQVRAHCRAVLVALGEVVLDDDQVTVVGAHVRSRAVIVDLAEVARRRSDRRKLSRPLPVFGAVERPSEHVADGAGEAGGAYPGALAVLADAVLVAADSLDTKML